MAIQKPIVNSGELGSRNDRATPIKVIGEQRVQRFQILLNWLYITIKIIKH
ncbi:MULTISPECIES: hypothetical protein [unclassified Candidatus Tisiphia]|uniref:hypothetical protein n=1 Tax=unclassified Candidatus Tisiphia TaxID=2996318 RepID=UPI003CCB3F6E